MRPVFRGTAPKTYAKYTDAGEDLKSRLGDYCSYCERCLPVSLAVEHIKPKKTNPLLATTWDNFLLGCANCNSAKGTKPTNTDDWLWPDQDNTFLALQYTQGGYVNPTASLDPVTKAKAQNLLDLVSLQKHAATKGKKPRKGDKRWLNREQVFAVALNSRADLEKLPTSARPAYLTLLVTAAVWNGFFSCWLTVFHDDPEVCSQIIARMPGTAGDCFDADSRPVARPGGRC